MAHLKPTRNAVFPAAILRKKSGISVLRRLLRRARTYPRIQSKKSHNSSERDLKKVFERDSGGGGRGQEGRRIPATTSRVRAQAVLCHVHI